MFYATPSAKEKLYQLGKDIPEIKLKQTVAKLQSTATEDVEEKLQRPVAEFPLAFALVPWGQHIDIVAKCKSIEEALFYILKTIDGNWSRETLMNCIKADLYHTQGGAITNFAESRERSTESTLGSRLRLVWRHAHKQIVMSLTLGRPLC